MPTGFYLLDKPKQGPTKWYATRKKAIQGVVVHVTAGLEDLDGGSDHSAERTAEYARTTDRAVSWHAGADTDTRIHLLPPTYTAFHCANYNSSTLGIEISKRHTDWFGMAPEWIRNTLTNAALIVADWWPILYAEGVPLVKVTRTEWDNGAKGFISHAELDPGRRSDPGWVKGGKDTFPWQQFFDACAAAIAPAPPEPEPPAEEDEVKRIIYFLGDDAWLANYDQGTTVKASGPSELTVWRASGFPEHPKADGEPRAFHERFKVATTFAG